MTTLQYLITVKRKWLVWITPASKVGGEWPTPIPFRSKLKAEDYARACRVRGQLTRITSPTA